MKNYKVHDRNVVIWQKAYNVRKSVLEQKVNLDLKLIKQLVYRENN
jgi:hypothetical protein